jgi:hypothetical protein
VATYQYRKVEEGYDVYRDGENIAYVHRTPLPIRQHGYIYHWCGWWHGKYLLLERRKDIEPWLERYWA